MEEQVNNPVLAFDEAYRQLIRTKLAVPIAEALKIVNRQIGTLVEVSTGPVEHKEKVPNLAQHWKMYEHNLSAKPGFDEDAIFAINHFTDRIHDRLPSLANGTARGRGLVLGYVQSGKTANMMGLIAKAADAGWNFVVILAGLTNVLREQTQGRAAADLLRNNKRFWEQLTDETSDFDDKKKVGFAPLRKGHVRLAVVKKNKHVLQKLCTRLEETSSANRRSMKVLVIDDECDQASVNAATRDADVTAINDAVRRLLGLLPFHAYVGYTATPFANVLIDPTIDPSRPEDLYPRDFIVSLPPPPTYFGTERLFGRGLTDAEDDGDAGLNVIHDIPAEEVDFLRPTKAPKVKKGESKPELADYWAPEMTRSLEDAIAWFLLSVAIRSLRGQTSKHASMLVHTTVRVIAHQMLARVISDHVDALTARLLGGDSQLLAEWEALHDRQRGMLPSETFGLKAEPFLEVIEELKNILRIPAGQPGAIELAIENSSSIDRLHYKARIDGRGNEFGRRYIVVGGSVLSRGLTIEGLSVSYFLRSSTQYDTLLQMGRWFGYRAGYEDLPRLWMTEDMRGAFQQLATVEAEIREDIASYSSDSGEVLATPLDLAVRIRHTPGMMVTSKAKMRAAKQLRVSWSGLHIQTRRFRRNDTRWLDRNLASLTTLLTGRPPANTVDGGRAWLDVDGASIQSFLKEYRVHPDHPEFDKDGLSGFVEKLSSSFGADRWNVALVEPATGRPAVGLPGTLSILLPDARFVNRAMFRHLEGGETADIKALMSRHDLMIDVRAALGAAPKASSWRGGKFERQSVLGPVPLLVLYLIDPGSTPQKEGSDYHPLEADRPVLGIGMVFPEVDDEAGALYYQVDLGDQEPEEELELPDELVA